MLGKLRELMPEYTITKLSSNLYDIKRRKKSGQWLHIPAYISKGDDLEAIAKSIDKSWVSYA